MSRWLAELAAGVAADPDPVAARARALAGVVEAVAAAHGIRLPPLELRHRWGRPARVAVPRAEAVPGVVPRATDALLPRSERRRLGAYATPPEVAAELVGRALDASPVHTPAVCDPAAGGGALLLAAAEAGVGMVRLSGTDVDPVSAAAATAALCLRSGGAAVPPVGAADALRPAPWPGRPDVVVGNPPFRSPLRGGAPTDRRLGPYADVAAAFLLRALDEMAGGGVVGLLLPVSFLASRDAAPARRRALEAAELVEVWRPDARFRGALVDVCAVVLRRGGGRRTTGASWAPLVADAPDVVTQGGDPVGARFDVAADFRAHYYAVAPHVVDGPADGDDAAFPPLVTAGLVDPAACAWGERPARHGGRRWAAPRVDLARLSADGHGDWARRRLVPKVVVASQTRVVEAAVDEAGAWLPSVPLVSVTGPVDRLWHAAAALLSPVTTAGVLRRGSGTALATDHLKLGAPQVRDLPLPPDGPDWDEAAAAVRAASSATDPTRRRAALLDAAVASCAAYGVPADGLVDWWAARLPPENGSRRWR
jgi:hypothetical protein